MVGPWFVVGEWTALIFVVIKLEKWGIVSLFFSLYLSFFFNKEKNAISKFSSLSIKSHVLKVILLNDFKF